MILSENKEILGIKPNNVKSSFLDKFQEYEPLYTCSPKNSFFFKCYNMNKNLDNFLLSILLHINLPMTKGFD